MQTSRRTPNSHLAPKTYTLSYSLPPGSAQEIEKSGCCHACERGLGLSLGRFPSEARSEARTEARVCVLAFD